MKPLVGVTTPDRGGRAARLLTSWLLRRAGARVRLLAPSGGASGDGIDALVLSGGDDIAPARYGAAPRAAAQWDEARDAFEWRLLEEAAAAGRPVLGICRGAQLLNVFHGGTLHQDLAEAIPGVRLARTRLPVATVRIEPGSRLEALLGVRAARVNSIHHQAVDRVAPGLRVCARDAAGIAEAVEAEDGPLRVGVQWHPEYMPWSRAQRRLFVRFVAAVASRGRLRAPGSPGPS